MTERRHEQIKPDDRLLLEIACGNDVGIWATNAEDRVVFFNPAMELLYGVTAETILGQNVRTAFSAATLGSFLKYYDQARNSLLSVKYTADIGAPGNDKCIQSRRCDPRVSDGRFNGMICSFTELTKTEETNRSGATLYRQLFNSMTEMFQVIELIHDESGRPIDYYYRDVNPAFEKLVGRPKEQIVGKRVKDLFEVVEDHWLAEYDKVARSGVSSRYLDYGAELDKYYDVQIWKVNDRELAVVFTDVTADKKTEEALQTIQKLQALGVVAGGIAHDFNNYLSGIFGYVEIAMRDSRDHVVDASLSKVMNTLDRARALTSQLLTFATGGAPIQKVAPLFPFVGETAEFVLSGKNVSCRIDVSSDLWDCLFDRPQLAQVIENIVINAQQAMPAGGEVLLSASNLTIEEGEFPELASGDYVRLLIQDTGCGIPKDLVNRIFDPFFTTKDAGTGLGLATCHSIIRRHGGYLRVESEIGVGSTFDVYLPASTEARLPETTEDPTPTHQGSGTFLIMDDDEMLRKTLGSMFESFGYTVVLKANGKEAVDFYTAATRGRPQISGMIFDLTVPGSMGGLAAVREIRRFDSDVPVFVASGYAEDPVITNPTEYGFTASIRKPFARTELARILNLFILSSEEG